MLRDYTRFPEPCKVCPPARFPLYKNLTICYDFAMENNKKKLDPLAILLGALLVILALMAALVFRYYNITHTHTPVSTHEPGEWFDLAPEGIVSGDGSSVTTRMRLGTENKVLILFHGGGISYNDYTAARPYLGLTMDVEPGFYSANTDGQIPDWCGIGIEDDAVLNPFRNWTVINIPYTTGDFHIGDTDYGYTALDGSDAVLHQHGYENYRAFMDAAMQYISDQPEELLVTGYSAGGYGAAMLTEDLMVNYFPDAGHVTVCVDSSVLILSNWTEIFRDVWNAPEQFTEKIRSANLIVDFLADLYDTYGDDITYLYVGSVRDGALARYQTYFDTGVYAASNRNVGIYTAYLREMIRLLRENVPTVGIYLFDSLPFSIRPNQFWLTQHTILETRTVFWRLTDRTPVIVWLDRAVSGNVTTLGLDLLR